MDGHSYEPKGDITDLAKYVGKDKLPKNLVTFSRCMTICNESKLMFDKKKN